ncbi:tetratricopeptide repeat protein [Actinoplanes sp. NPDC051343]|uniref:tetratricopeptide repeat protein n=1 Tax=Actinoplanes sp. NPDC051343 TaxID=3363906 RepID=UPI0037A61E44
MAAGGERVPLVGYARYLNDLLRRLRVENGSPSLRELARRIPASPGHVSGVFSGKKMPSPEFAESIAKALNAGDTDRRAARQYAEAAAGDEPSGTEGDAVPWRVETFRAVVPPVPEGAAPSALLSARYQVVGFTGRIDELRESAQWRDGPGTGLRVRLLHGQGGQGKTRLAAEFAVRSGQAGWVVGQVRHRSDTVRPGKALPAGRSAGAAGVLLVLDYAERWPVEDLVSCLAGFQGGVRGDGKVLPVRVLLLARPSGGWWQGVRAALHEHDIAAVTDHHLLPLVTAAADRQALFDAARDRFADLLGFTGAETLGPPSGLGGDPEYGRALTVQMAALAAVGAAMSGSTPPAAAGDLSTYLLDRERRHWQKLYAKTRAGDGGGTDETALATSPAVMAHTVYTAILTRPLPQPAGAAVLVRAGIATDTDAGRVLSDHAVCYPPTDPGTVLEPLYPDRLGEDFLALSSPGNPSGGADPWAATAISTLLTPDSNKELAPYTRQAVTVLIEAARRWPHLADHLFPLLRAHPRLALAASGAALTTLAETPGVDLALLEALEPLLPADRHIDLDIAAAAITTQLTTHRLARTTDAADQAQLHATLALRLANAGRREQALAPAEDAASIYRRLAEAHPDAYLPNLATSLNNLGTCLAVLGRREQALAPAEEATGIYRRLAEAHPDAYLPDLATSLNNFGACLARLGRREQALAPAEDATGIYRRLAEAHPDAYLPDLATSLNNFGAFLSELGRRGQALAPAEEAVTIRRRLAEANPDAYLPDLAMSLNNLGNILSELGRREQALAPAEEAVTIRRRLAEANPDAYQPDLAGSLNNLGTFLSGLGRREHALAPAEEATGIYRRLAEAHPDAYLPDLAGSLNNFGAFLSGLGRRERALAPAEEATGIYRRLAEAHPDAYLPDLAMSLNNFGAFLSGLGRRERALAPAEEAVTIRRRLAEANPDAYLPDLAGSLNNLGTFLAKLGRREQALAPAEEAVTIRRRLAEANPDAYLPDLATSLWAHGWVCVNVKANYAEALDSLTEAISLYEPLARQLPQMFAGHLISAYRTLTDVLDGLGRTEEAAGLRQQLDDAAGGRLGTQ